MTDIELAEKEIKEVLKKYKLKTGYEMSFPIYRIIPDEVKLAMAVLARHGMNIYFTLKEIKEK